MNKTIMAMVAIATLSPTLYAATADERAAQIHAEFRAGIEAIQAEAARLKDDRPSDLGAVVGIDCKIEMNRKEIKLHLPTVEMKLQTWTYDLPEFFWGITTAGPIKLHLPQVRMKRHRSTLHVPESFMKLHTIKLDVPEFFCRDTKVELRRIKGRGQELAAEGQVLAQKMQDDLRQMHVEAIYEQRGRTIKEFDDAIAGLNAWINEVNKRNGSTGELASKLRELQAQREAILKSFEAALRELA